MARWLHALHALVGQQWVDQWPTVADVKAGRHVPPERVRICRLEGLEVIRSPVVPSSSVEWDRLLDTDCVVPEGGADDESTPQGERE